ncbi:Gfo/Idh/MocA family protein [Bacteroidota bacterium]
MQLKDKRLKLQSKRIRRLKWGVAGCGRFLEGTFLPTLQQVKRSKLVSVYSSDIHRAKYIANKFGAQYYYNSFDEFLASDIEAVYISSKNSDHFWQVAACANAGKKILCEKPLALDSNQASEMINLCKENNALLSINYVYRFHPLVVKTKELIDKNTIGKIVSISADFNIDFAPGDNFRFVKSQSGGGALRDIGTHMIDILRYFGGEIVEIKGFLDNVVYKSDVEDFANGIVKFSKSGYGYFTASYNSKSQFNRIEIIGYNGCISIDNMIGRKTVTSKLTIDLYGEARKAFRRRANKQLLLLRSIQKSFLKNEKPLITGEDGLVNIELMEALENSCP